jgi:integrase
MRVKYVEQKVRAYRPDELKALFAVATPEEWILFQFFLCTGAREQEVMYAEWNDVDFVDGLFTVKAKANWKPKDYEEREIPLPDFLVAALKKRMLSTKGDLIFPQPEGKPDGHMLRKLKYRAKRAGLHGEFKLHKWRKSLRDSSAPRRSRRKDYPEEARALGAGDDPGLSGRRGRRLFSARTLPL